MGRPIRDFHGGGIFHLTTRGSDRRLVFRTPDDRVDFLERARATFANYGVKCLSYCLMTNHYHLLVQIRDDRLSPAMRDLNGGYSRRCRVRYGTDAHVFRNRFGAKRITTNEHLIVAAAYTDLNPVKAGMCQSPDEYAWSSYRATVGLEPPQSVLTSSLVLDLFDVDRNAARTRYRSFVESRVPAVTSSLE
jgi:putative transposase